MNRLSTVNRVAVVKALVEGNSIRATVRLTGVVSPVAVAMPLAVIVFLFFTKPGRAVIQGLHKNQSN